MDGANKYIRNDAVSVAKGIAIILMVVAHTHCPLWLSSYIYMFHMPLFFFFSGYCFKAMYLENTESFCKRRFRGLYWPYVKWGLVFLLLHNVFFYLNIYNMEYGFRGEVSHLYDIKEHMVTAISLITRMKGEEQLLGAYWFLHTMFFASFIFYLILFICKKKKVSAMYGIILIPLTILLLYTGKVLPYFDIGVRETLAAFFMLIGYCYKQKNLHVESYMSWIVIPICAGVVALGANFWWGDMFHLNLFTILPYILTALVGILMVFSVSQTLLAKDRLRRLLTFIGNKTLPILTWHFLSFKLISLLIIMIYSLPYSRLAEFPVIEEYARLGWCWIYLMIGISLPLLWSSVRFVKLNRYSFMWGFLFMLSV